MTLKSIFLVLLLLLVQSLTGQEFLWEAIYANGGPSDVVMDMEGNVYVTGWTGTATNMNIRTAKYASEDGVEEWSQVWSASNSNSAGFAICLDASANVYVVGSQIEGSWPNQLQRLVVLKYNCQGDWQWANNERVQYSRENRWYIAVDNSDGVYVASDSFDVPWLVKLNTANGSIVWTDTTDVGNYGTWRAIVVDDGDSICVAGSEEVGESDEHLWTARYKSNGERQWKQEYFPPDGYAGADGIDIDNIGNIYVGGTCNYGAGSRGLIVKYASNGEFRWARHLHTAQTAGCYGIKVHRTSGASYITGNVQQGNSADVYVHAVDVDGCSLWISTYGGSGTDVGYDLGVTDSCVYVGGTYVGHILVLCYARENGALQWAEIPAVGSCYEIAVQRTDAGDAYIVPTFYSYPGWRTLKYYYCETIDPMALVYNGNRHLVRVPNTEELHLVYTRGGEVVYRHSSNAGVDWSLPVSLGNGKYPAIALDCADSLSVTWTDDAGGLWYRRKINENEWTDTYHLWNPVDIGDLRLNAPPSIAIDHRSRPNKGHILVTRSGGEPNRDIAHTVEDYTFFITEPLGGSFVLIEQTQSPNLYPPLRSNPSIARCEVDNSMHATWQRVDTICYARKPPSQSWDNWGWQFYTDGLQSAHPFVETYGDSIYVVWQHLDPSTQKEEVYRARRYRLWDYFLRENLSRTSDLVSLYPVNASGFFTAYVEEPIASSPYEIYYKVRPEDDRRNVSNTAYNSLYPQCAARFTLYNYLYTAWQEGDEAPYEICFKKIRHEEMKDMAYLTSPNGYNLPSPYLVARDSFISNWQIPVDIGNMTTTYQFPLVPGYAYKAKAVVYHEGSGPWSGRIKIDNNLQFVVTYNANVPETLECWIPPALYEDSVLTVSFNRISGAFAAIGPIYIYRYEYEGGGGPMSQLSQPMHNTSLTVFPNPFTENLNITYQIAAQNGADLKLYDVIGRLVKQFDIPSDASFNHIIWDGVDDHGRIVPQGVYFLRIDNIDSDGIICQKVLRVK